MASSVVLGSRGIESVVNPSPSEAELPRALAHAKATLEAVPLKPGERMFVTNSRHYVYQLTAPALVTDPQTGLPTSPRPKVAEFMPYIYRTSDQWTIKRIEGDKLYGIEIKDAVTAVEARSAQIIERLLNQVTNLATPDQVESLIHRLNPLAVVPGQKTIPLPKRESKVGAKA